MILFRFSAPSSRVHIFKMSHHFEVVIAHFNEDLEWVGECAQDAVVYYKGERPPGKYRRLEPLPNTNRESGTYLTHIIRNYDDLADVTLFLQGNIHDWNHGTPPHTDLPLSKLKTRATKLTPDEMMAFGPIKQFSHWDGMPWLTDGTGYFQRRGKGMRMSNLTPGEFWKFVFGTEHPAVLNFSQGALFAVGRNVIRARPLEFWTRLLKYFDDLNHVNPEEGHYMERFWMTIFTPEGPRATRKPGSKQWSQRICQRLKILFS